MYINKRRSEPKSQIYSLSLTRNKAKKLTVFDKLFEGTLCDNDDLLTSRADTAQIIMELSTLKPDTK